MGKNKLILHCCGGGGINIGYFLKDNNMPMTGRGFADTEIRFIDTSASNIRKADLKAQFWEVELTELGKSSTDGSGSVRAFNVEVIEKSINKYIKENEALFTEDNIGTYHLIVFTASGGTGSVIGPKLLQKLLMKKVPAAAFIIGDNSSDVYVTNTIKTLAGLDHMLRGSKNVDGHHLAGSAFYLNNSHFETTEEEGEKKELSVHDRVVHCNKLLFNVMTQISILVSGDHKNLDYQDLCNIFNFRRLNKELPGGLYAVYTSVGMRQMYIPENSKVLVMISLTTPEYGDNSKLKVLHYKSGEFTAIEEVKEEFNKRNITVPFDLPIRIALFAGCFAPEIKDLTIVKEDYNKNFETITNKSLAEEIEGLNGVEDSDGMFY